MPTIDRGRRLYSFAVVSDTHLNQSDAECNSPFDVNRRANNRLRYVIEDLNRRDIELALHLGDIVHPVPSMRELYAESSRRFFEQLKKLRHPLYLIPGNHDVGDKPIPWGPAGGVRDDFLQAWSEHFGAHYFHHEHRGIHFIGINAQLPGSGLALEREQKHWLENLLNDIDGGRIFIGSHYPPYLLAEDEPEHYDNLGAAGRAWLLSLLSRHRVEALFCGHVHQYWFNRHAQTQCYLLPSTAFTRQDYSEMFRINGAREYGRNDEQKLGYLLVHLYQHGHGVEVVRTAGRELEARDAAPAGRRELTKPPGFVNFHSRFGFNLRQDWFETVQIPPSGGLDEFDRKSARNDYGLLALLDMGIRRLRLPLADLLQPVRRRRLLALQSLGFRYRFYSFDAPGDAARDIIRGHPGLVGEWEICCPVERVDALDDAFFELAESRRIELVFSPLRSKHEMLRGNQTYYHVINHGFSPGDSDAALGKWLGCARAAAFAKYSLRLSFDESVGDAVAFARAQYEQSGKKAVIRLRLSADNPAQNIDDDAWLCRRLAEAVALGHAHDECEIDCDTFADSDRGYFPHAGVVDRLYNPRPGMLLIRHLNILLAEIPEGQSLPREHRDGLVVYELPRAARAAWLCLPDGDGGDAGRRDRLDALIRRRIGDPSEWDLLDLISGSLVNLKTAIESPPPATAEFPFALLAR